jgi:hypothetical protein
LPVSTGSAEVPAVPRPGGYTQPARISAQEDAMARKHKESEPAAATDHTHDFEHQHGSGWGRRLAMLLAVVGGIFFFVKRNQRRSELDEGVWHEAPSS